MGKREHAYFRVGKDKAAYQVISQITLDRVAKRFLNEGVPRLAGSFVNFEPTRHFLFGNQRLEHRIPDAFSKYPRQPVKAL